MDGLQPHLYCIDVSQSPSAVGGGNSRVWRMQSGNAAFSPNTKLVECRRWRSWRPQKSDENHLYSRSLAAVPLFFYSRAEQSALRLPHIRGHTPSSQATQCLCLCCCMMSVRAFVRVLPASEAQFARREEDVGVRGAAERGKEGALRRSSGAPH
jgi:hypothetical protein